MNTNCPPELSLTLHKIKTKINFFNTIILLRHQDPDGDAIGSTLGLGLFLQKHYPDKKILTDGEPNPHYLKFLSSLPTATPADYEGALVIVCDTANTNRVDGAVAWKDAAYIIKIDHHPQQEVYGDLQLVDSNRVAACELVMELLYSYHTDIPANAANAVFTGLITDSNRFLFPKTGPRTFELVAWISKFIPNVNEIYDALYLKSIDNLSLIQKLITKIEFIDVGIAYIIVKQSELESWGTDYRQVKAKVNLMAGYTDIKIWFIAVDCEVFKKIKISIRSRDADCSTVSMQYGGGGHTNAAACWLDNWEQLKPFIQDLKISLQQN